MGHHMGYTTTLNTALKKIAETDPELVAKGIDAILLDLDSVPEATRTTVRNAGGGYVNHALFWSIMAPGAGGEATGAVADAIVAAFGSFDAYKAEFTKAAATVFGSGWAWLYVDQTDGNKLKVMATKNQDTPAMEAGKVPILGLDVWEHAYYLKYQNKRAAYIEAWWNVVNWEEVNRRYAAATASA